MAETKIEETTDAENFLTAFKKANKFLLIWLGAMVLTFVTAMARGDKQPTDGLVESLMTWFSILTFIAGWIMAIVGLFILFAETMEEKGMV